MFYLFIFFAPQGGRGDQLSSPLGKVCFHVYEQETVALFLVIYILLIVQRQRKAQGLNKRATEKGFLEDPYLSIEFTQ